MYPGCVWVHLSATVHKSEDPSRKGRLGQAWQQVWWPTKHCGYLAQKQNLEEGKIVFHLWGRLGGPLSLRVT